LETAAASAAAVAAFGYALVCLYLTIGMASSAAGGDIEQFARNGGTAPC